MISQTAQRLVTGGLVALAVAALGFGAAYEGEQLPEGPTDTVLDVGPVGGAATPSSVVPVDPVEGFLPRSGQASACQEAVGVDLAPGYAATLTINGVAIAPEEMNVVLEDDGSISRTQTASRSLGLYTYGPEEGCPNGRVLRPTGNVLRACVYRVEDGPSGCTITENTFDVL